MGIEPASSAVVLDGGPRAKPDRPRKKYRTRTFGAMTDEDVLYLLQTRVYTVDLTNGDIFGPCGNLRRTYPGGRRRRHLFVRLVVGERRRAIGVHVLCWMAGMMMVVPPNFEVHHVDECPKHNAFENLIAVHEIDHRKLHRHTQDEVIPF